MWTLKSRVLEIRYELILRHCAVVIVYDCVVNGKKFAKNYTITILDNADVERSVTP